MKYLAYVQPPQLTTEASRKAVSPLYWPKEEALDGAWHAPKVTKG
ncbi:hypothetical protein P3H80_07760 [Mycolicibacterium septicum]|nr:hypothetical protein [Mycolicibacterium septicum]MDF3337311.1 hypothetical protein [Mycolicibacterium septicum]